MTPLRPEAVFFAILSGNAADSVLISSVESINGLRNQRFGGAQQRPGDPAFFRLVELLRNLQRSGALTFRVKESKDKGETNILFFRKGGLAQEDLDQMREAKQLLNLAHDEQEFQLVFGVAAESNREIAVQTRSLIQIMLEVGAMVEVPEAHVTEGRATPGFVETSDGRKNVRFMNIHGSPRKSEYAFLSIRYRDHWFWIDDRDIKTKQKFAYVMYLFALAETGAKQPLPLVTIPAQ